MTERVITVGIGQVHWQVLLAGLVAATFRSRLTLWRYASLKCTRFHKICVQNGPFS